jgi:hypothetical protein
MHPVEDPEIEEIVREIYERSATVERLEAVLDKSEYKEMVCFSGTLSQ